VLMRRRPLGGGFLMPPALRVEHHWHLTAGDVTHCGKEHAVAIQSRIEKFDRPQAQPALGALPIVRPLSLRSSVVTRRHSDCISSPARDP
jgi:hypothetical protein